MPLQTANLSALGHSLLLIDREAAAVTALEANWAADGLPVLVPTSCGRHAVELLRGGNFPIIVADIASILDLSPEPDEAMRRLVKAGADSLIIALSDACSVSASLAAMRAGAHDYLSKPIEAPALIARLAALAMRHGRVPAPATEAEQPAELEGGRSLAEPMESSIVLPMWRQEQRIIEEAIRRFSGNIAAAAAALEVSPSTIYRKRQAWAAVEKGAA
ncbi:MAG TPA: DNA-binding response regulator [Devosia sp.]|nr:DNA-binding response regulator [Devosia sp.]